MTTIQTELDQIVAEHFPGAFLYIEEANGSSRFYTSGFADLANRLRMKPDNRYRVGSTTKTFTAVVTLQLVHEGRLALADTLEQHLADMNVPNASIITIEHLLRMRSGVFDFEEDEALKGSLEAHLKPYRLSEAVQMGVRHPALFMPGEKFSYSNTNFCLLEMIIERVTGNSLGEEISRRILVPLKMTSTLYPAWDDLSLPEPYIRGYERTTEGWFDCSRVFFGRGDGALLSTALDMGRFFRALLCERILLPAPLLEQMMTVSPVLTPEEHAYGMGLFPIQQPCGALWGHTGGGQGYDHSPFLDIQTGRFAIFMSNGTYYTLEDPTAKPNFRERIAELRRMVFCEG